MSSHTPVHLGFVDKLRLGLSLIVGIFWALAEALPPLAATQTGPFKRRLGIAYVRNVLSIPYLLRRALEPTTGAAITAYCTAQKLSLQSVSVDSVPPATLHFVECDASSAGKRLLYFHGGGYTSPISGAGHIPFVLECAKAANASLVLLEYGLAPEHPYPAQIPQAVEALRYMLRHRSANDVILGGDSAGGHLALSLISHIKERSPHAPSLDLQGQELAGLLLISPWVGLEYTAPSYKSNAGIDYLHPAGLRNVTRIWNPAKNEIWANPISGSAAFWSTIPAAKILIVAGAWEVFLDDIKVFAENVLADGKNRKRTTFAECPGEVHDACVVDAAVKFQGGSMSTEIFQWLGRI